MSDATQARRSLLGGVASTTVGNVVYTASQFGMLVTIAQLSCLATIGQYALALAITAPIFMFTGLKLRQVQVTDAMGHNQAGEYFGLRAITSVLALTASVGSAWLADASMSTVAVVTAVAVFKGLEAQVDILYGAMQRREELHLVAWHQILRGVGGLSVFAAALRMTEQLWIALATVAAFTLIPIATCTWTVRRLGVSPRLELRPSPLLPLARLAFPLGIAMAIASLLTNVPRYAIDAFLGISQLGVFAALSYFLVATGVVAGAIGEAASPRLADLYATRESLSFANLVRRLCALGLGLGIAGIIGTILLGRLAIDVLFGAEYSPFWDVLLILMLGATVQYASVFLGTAANAVRLFRVQLAINVAGLLVVAVASLVLVPGFGLRGAAWAIVASQVVQAALWTATYRFAVAPQVRRRSLEHQGAHARRGTA